MNQEVADPGVQLNPRTRALEAYIEASVAQLREGREAAGDGLLFLASLHESLPVLALQDPVLEPVDKTLWANIWLWAKQRGRRAAAFPSYEELMRITNVHSRATVARSLAILRLTRWITLCHRVRGPRGRYLGNVYALHDEPLSLADTCHLDPEYMGFLERCAAAHGHERVRTIARGVLATIRGDVEAGADVLDGTSLAQADRRAEALTTLRTRDGGFFAFNRDALGRLIARLRPSPKSRSDTGAGNERRPSDRQDMNRAQNLNLDQVQNLNLVSSNFELRSSYLIKTTTTTDPVGAGDRGTQRNGGEGRPAVPLSSCDSLIFPDGFTLNERCLAGMCLQGVAEDLQQAVLDELAGQIRTRKGTANPIRNPLGWLQWACRELKAGHMILTSLGVKHRERRDLEPRLAETEAARQRALTEAARKGARSFQEALAGGCAPKPS